MHSSITGGIGVRAAHPKGKRTMGVFDLLCWAFGAEHAQLDFDEFGFSMRSGLSSQTRILQQGCRVDGGGWSNPHHDADLIACEVADLPVSVGGKSMAIYIAELARAGLHPDWMQGTVPTCEPIEWTTNRHGTHAKQVPTGEKIERRNRKGVVVYDDVMVCPVRWRNTPDQIARSRRAYLAWYGALLELRSSIGNLDLEAHEVSDLMPVRAPWRLVG